MSSQLTSLVPVFDGSNWAVWSKNMQAFFMSQGLWGYVDGSIVLPAGAGVDPADIATWNRNDEMARGNLTLRLSPAIQQAVTGTTARLLWDSVKDRYGAVSLPIIYKDFKEAISICFNPNQHPAPQFEKMAAAFSRLGAVTVGTGANAVTLDVKDPLQALIALAALPPKWEPLIPIICSNVNIEDLDLSDVSTAVISQYETESNRGQHKGTAHNAQKISAVKRKRENPRFTKQGNSQQPSGSNSTNQQQPFRQRGSRGSGQNHKNKGKGKQSSGVGHSHVASVAVVDLPPTHIASEAALPSPTTHNVLHIGTSGTTKRTIQQSSPVESTTGFYPLVNKALSLAEWLDVPATVQTVKTLEQRFADFDQQIRPRLNTFMDEEDDEDFDVDMSHSTSLQTIDHDDWSSESSNALGLDFGDLTIEDGGSDKENRAPTPAYVDPSSLESNSQEEIEAMWVGFNQRQTIRRKSSNEIIDEINRKHREYMMNQMFGTLVSPKGSRAPTPDPSASSFDDTVSLDWGSDEERYASFSLNAHHADCLTVSDHALRKSRDGACKNKVVWSHVTEVSSLYNMTVGALDILRCEHNEYFGKCAKCRKRIETMWLLDSGASAHFTNKLSDFIEYEPIPKSDRIPVRTAAHVIWVEGTGTALLRHYINKTLVITRVHPVLYIPQMSTRLLSMGVFLQQGMRVLGNLQQINLLNKMQPFVQCKPLMTGQTLYWLDAESASIDTQVAEIPDVYKVDYDLMHRRLGHPSKEVLRHAKDHTKGFPDGITIPTNSDICPGCAQGKMPAASHPLSTTRASAPFQRIHSDLKSFPVPSYHKYEYFIVFFDDHTSYAWITLLCNKASAITAFVATHYSLVVNPTETRTQG